MRVYLIGYMASGKSNLGRELAGVLGFEFVDLDVHFESRFRISVSDFFDKYDETAFRKIERDLLLETVSMEDTVISTGGGTPCFYDNMEVIRRSGISLYLRWDPGDLAERLIRVKRRRPLLRDVADDSLESRIRSDLRHREYFYRQADCVMEGREATASELAAVIRNGIPVRDP